jgi:hypothetical protein
MKPVFDFCRLAGVGGKTLVKRCGRPTNCTNSTATSCLYADRVSKVPKPENLLKTKGLRTDFSPAKPENILKRNPLTNKSQKA